MPSTSPAAKFAASILTRLGEGTIPWRKPWTAKPACPRNLVSGRPYSGGNVVALLMTHPVPFWLTFNQARNMKWSVLPGSKAAFILWAEPHKRLARPGEAGDENGFVEYFARKAYAVFNAVDVAGAVFPKPTFSPTGGAKALFDSLEVQPKLLHTGDRAYFERIGDFINLPDPASFPTQDDYWATALHELSHWAGHASRLDRSTVKDAATFGDEMYSQEELVAELSSHVLCGLTGVQPSNVSNSEAYIQNWMKKFEHDPAILMRAATHADQCVRYLCKDYAPARDYLFPEQGDELKAVVPS